MSDPLIVILPERWMARSREWGDWMIEDYEKKRIPAVAGWGCFDAEKNRELQAAAKACECAMAWWCGINPGKLHWDRDSTDGGADLTWPDIRWDVKGTSMNGEWLIWPISKNTIYPTKKFDRLMLVKHHMKDSRFRIFGWATKQEFADNHKEASATVAKKLARGTWCLHQSLLWSAGLLPR